MLRHNLIVMLFSEPQILVQIWFVHIYKLDVMELFLLLSVIFEPQVNKDVAFMAFLFIIYFGLLKAKPVRS